MNTEDENIWASGGIFGAAVDDAVEVLDELNTAPYPDGNGGFRSGPGPGNVLGARDVVSQRKMDRARRAKMLLVERFIDELPDVRDKVREMFVSGDVTEMVRGKIVNFLAPAENFAWGMEQRPMHIRAALRYLVREVAVEVTGEAFLRAYQKDVQRARAAVRLGSFSPEDWAAMQTQRLLEAPAAAAEVVSEKAEAIAARLKHIASAVFEPLDKPAPTMPTVEAVPKYDEDAL